MPSAASKVLQNFTETSVLVEVKCILLKVTIQRFLACMSMVPTTRSLFYWVTRI